ncbi:unnamed protein product [Ilex paraguariensis]|uniref:Uncharacterized protein n=1 Tax=Ilex paraguariensis TaxID=185542 RepID=A0ABC8RHZ6_9AQUA
MVLLDQLWDETVAGPRPDTGLGKLRKHSTFSFRSCSGKDSDVGNPRSYSDDSMEDSIRVTRSIMIVKPRRNQNELPPVSPAGSISPVSAFAGELACFLFF